MGVYESLSTGTPRRQVHTDILFDNPPRGQETRREERDPILSVKGSSNPKFQPFIATLNKKQAGSPREEGRTGRPFLIVTRRCADWAQPSSSSALGSKLAKSSLLGHACRAASRSAPDHLRATSDISE
jgi:hypothetical protein